jgi:hypothetical protein
MPDTSLEGDHPRIISAKLGFSSLTFGMKNNSAALEYTRLPSLLPLARSVFGF